MQPAYSLASWGRIDTPISRREDSVCKNMLWQILYESTKNVKVMYLYLYIEDSLKSLDEKFFKWHLSVREARKTKMVHIIENIPLIFGHVDSERRKKMHPRILSMNMFRTLKINRELIQLLPLVKHERTLLIELKLIRVQQTNKPGPTRFSFQIGNMSLYPSNDLCSSIKIEKKNCGLLLHHTWK